MPYSFEGRIKKINEDHPDVSIYCAAVDEKLDSHGYILPGLGDAGDRLLEPNDTKCIVGGESL